MILYTPVPVELLFSGSSREFKEVVFGEAKIITEVDAEGTCRIVRLISCNPDDYLNPDLQPGCEIKYKPVFGGQ